MDASEVPHQRLRIVRAHLEGASVSEIARREGVSRPTVRLWIGRFKREGLAGLLSRKSPGRPREIHPRIRAELLRLPQASRPPFDLGDQWSVRSLAEAFGVSPSFVSLVWRESGFEPPLHLSQALANPDRRTTLLSGEIVPAWLRLHLELCRQEGDPVRGQEAEGLTAAADAWPDERARLLPGLERRWTDYNESLPRVDPRSLLYLATLVG